MASDNRSGSRTRTGVQPTAGALRPIRRASTILLFVTALAVCVLGAASIRSAVAAPASGNIQIALPDRGIGFTDSPSAPLLDVSTLVPGKSTSATMGVLNTSGDTADISLGLTNVVKTDTCPAGASYCSRDTFNLDSKLLITLAVSDTEGGAYDTVAKDVSAAQFAATAKLLASGVADGGTRWVTMTASLPSTVGNEVQAERLTFDVQVILQGKAGDSTVVVGPGDGGSGGGSNDGGGSKDGGGSGIDAGTAHRSGIDAAVDHLAFTGASTPLALTLGSGLLLAGLVLIVLGWRRVARRNG